MNVHYSVIFFLLAMLMSFQPNKVQKVVFFGDSITAAGADNPEGYINLMRKEVDTTQCQLIGRGIGGNKVTDLENRIDKDVLSLHPDIVFLYIGINDVWHFYEPEGAVGTELSRYEEGLRTLAKKMQKQDIRIVFCTPTVIGEDPAFEGKINAELDQYAEVVRKVANDAGSELCDLRMEMKKYLKTNNPDAKNSGILTSDRVHMNKNGNRFLMEQMLPFLNE